MTHGIRRQEHHHSTKPDVYVGMMVKRLGDLGDIDHEVDGRSKRGRYELAGQCCLGDLPLRQIAGQSGEFRRGQGFDHAPTLVSSFMSSIPGDQIGALMHSVVPMVATLGLEYPEVAPDRAVVVLRDQPAYRNHVGGPHAAAMFAAAESATGAAAIAAFGDLMERAVLLPTTVTMDYLSIARGDLTATAWIDADIEKARAQFEAGERPEFDIVCDITDAGGVATGRLRARWTLKALRRDG